MKVKVQKVVELESIPREFSRELEPLFRQLTSVSTELENLQSQAVLLTSAQGAEVMCVGMDRVRRLLFAVDNVLDGWLAIALDLQTALSETEQTPEEEKDGD